MPTFQHGKNAFLAVGYDASNVPTTVGSSATESSLTMSGISDIMTAGVTILPGGSVYGFFVNGIPCGGTTSPIATTPLTIDLPSAPPAGAPILPMVNLSPYLNDIGFPQTIDPADTTAFSQAGVKTYIVGLKGYTLTFSGMYDPTTGSSSTTGGIDQIVYDMENWQGFNIGSYMIPFIYGPANPGAFDGQTPSIKYYGNAWITKYELKSSVSGVITFDSELQVTGYVSRTVL